MNPILLATTAQAREFLGMTFPNFRARLAQLSEEPALVAVAAWSVVPAGLALAEIKGAAGQAEILSLFVASSLRGQGNATQLLAALEAELHARGVAQLYLTYPAGNPTTPALERVLWKCGWSEPRPHMLLYRFTNWNQAQLFAPAWMQKTTLPADYAIFPWSELTAADRNALQSRAGETPWYPQMLAPLKEEQCIEPSNSLGLRYRGQVAGWLITHRIAPDTIRYTCLFVRPELPFKGAGLRLLAEGFRRHYPAMPSNSSACFGTHADNPFVKFIERRLLSMFRESSCTRTMMTVKELAQISPRQGSATSCSKSL